MLWLTWFWRHVSSLCSHQLLWQIPHADQPDSHLWSNSQELPCNSSGLCRTWVNYHAVLQTVCPMICVQNKDIITVCIIETFQGQGSYIIENTPNQVFQQQQQKPVQKSAKKTPEITVHIQNEKIKKKNIYIYIYIYIYFI